MEQKTTADKKYIIGIVIQVAGIAICLNAYMIIYGFFLYLIGVAIVLFSKKRILAKILTAILPFLLYLITINIYDFNRARNIPTTYIIPDNFNGQVKIAYGLECGIEPEFINGKRILKIPQNGILLLKSGYENGIINCEDELYCFEGDASRKIPEIYFIDQYDSLKQSILVGGTGIMDTSYFHNKAEIIYTYFHVFNNDTTHWTNELLSTYDLHRDSLFDNEIKKCIGK